jgi:hypothetical protein
MGLSSSAIPVGPFDGLLPTLLRQAYRSFRSRSISYLLLDACYRLRNASYQLHHASCRLLNVSYLLHNASYRLLSGSCLLRDASCRLLGGSYLLRDASYPFLDHSCRRPNHAFTRRTADQALMGRQQPAMVEYGC